MVRGYDKEKRKTDILNLIIKSFINTCMPISSDYLCEHFRLNCSPATVRNDMAELEEEGYLYQPHTSSGRVPTEKGYKYFVDFFLKKKNLLEEEKKKILKILEEVKNLDKLLSNTSQILAELTHKLSFVAFEGEVEKIFSYGIKYIAREPEFQDLERLYVLFDILEDEEFLWGIFHRFPQGVEEHILIGSDLGTSSLKDFSMVVGTYKLHNEPKGRLAVFGPLRMDYEKVVAEVDFISRKLNEILERFI